MGAGAVVAVATVDVLAAVGLIQAAALGIAPVLVPLAAVGAASVTTGAVLTRIRRHEADVVVALVYLALVVFVAWGRFGPGAFTG
ncbi:DoxX family protein [Streptomyces sp. NBC_01483]|uniref:DoxX family protein n=1 Tax=Streptomyces sp. NBC_01483 TaxID=2903883 RepID=UPI002E31DA12|nr:DoxX family protein [Streptomyces sp. NBC_01483]